MSTEPTSKLVWSTDPTVKTERPQHRTPRHTFLVFQPHVRNASALSLRRTDGYGSAAIGRVWLDK